MSPAGPFSDGGDVEARVLVLTPTGDDAVQAVRVLREAQVQACAVADVDELAREFGFGAGALIIAEEALADVDLTFFLEELESQPKWSDLPLLLLAGAANATDGGKRFLDLFAGVGSFSFIDRPLRPLTLVTAARSALRARRRQYQVRDLLEEQARLYEQAAQAVKVRDDFISIASHELKTPLTSLSLRLQSAARDFDMAANRLPSTEKLQRLFSIGTHQLQRLNALVDDLLDVTRILNGKLTMRLEYIDLADVVQSSVERLKETAAAASCELEQAIVKGLWGSWDPSRLEQVVLNLVANALKYAPGCRVSVTLSLEQGRAILAVCDGGPGVPAELQQRIFDRFERANTVRQNAGLGLGLYIVRQIVEAHHGSVWVESAPGTGARFVVALPVYRSQAPDAVP